MQAVLEQNLITETRSERESVVMGQKIGFFSSLFGCQHKRMTRPITTDFASYRACIECGARKKFDTEDFTSSGPFYFPPSVKPDTLSS